MKSLKRLSDARLLNQLHELVHQEHDLTCEILSHLIEVEGRGVYRSLGHGSMYAYCTDRLKLEAEHLPQYNERGAAKRPERVFGHKNQERFRRKRE